MGLYDAVRREKTPRRRHPMWVVALAFGIYLVCSLIDVVRIRLFQAVGVPALCRKLDGWIAGIHRESPLRRRKSKWQSAKVVPPEEGGSALPLRGAPRGRRAL